jgi:four helix bundle protein
MSNKVQHFEDLKIWVSAMDLSVEIYAISKNLKEYYLKDQLNRAALSISNNIAEGFEYNNNPDFMRFLKYAKGSGGEVRNMLAFLVKANLISQEEFITLKEKTFSLSKQIRALMNYIENYKETANVKEDAAPYGNFQTFNF